MSVEFAIHSIAFIFKNKYLSSKINYLSDCVLGESTGNLLFYFNNNHLISIQCWVQHLTLIEWMQKSNSICILTNIKRGS